VALTWLPVRVSTGDVKHVPERHQSVTPPPSVLLMFAGLVAVMVVIYVVVALAA
jgi:hypothetical protein